MKQGLKKFDGNTQGERATQGQKVGENFIKSVLDILGISILENKSYIGVVNKISTSMKPDFIIKPSKRAIVEFGNIDFLFLESKFKQIQGSDWEKIESNFGYHEFFYNDLCGIKIKTIVILSGFWKKLQKNYNHFIYYFKYRYGENVIFDFGESIEEIFRFAKLMNIDISNKQNLKLKKIWDENFKNEN